MTTTTTTTMTMTTTMATTTTCDDDYYTRRRNDASDLVVCGAILGLWGGLTLRQLSWSAPARPGEAPWSTNGALKVMGF